MGFVSRLETTPVINAMLIFLKNYCFSAAGTNSLAFSYKDILMAKNGPNDSKVAPYAL